MQFKDYIKTKYYKNFVKVKITFLIKESGKEEIFFTLLKEINWILLFPIHNILKGIGFPGRCAGYPAHPPQCRT
jgi:hypothetical protein